jgi:hypothetical protein
METLINILLVKYYIGIAALILLLIILVIETLKEIFKKK